ncbi:hypothetical protein [Alcanivorax quisquiliarum]|nr:hypothetical protein [Alcanivorax quisquiliarum]
MKRNNVIAIALFSQIAFAHGAPIMYERTDLVTSAVEQGVLDIDGLSDTFSGTIAFQKQCISIPVNFTCEFSLSTRISDNGTEMAIKLSDLASSGPGWCSGITAFNPSIPWSGQIPYSELPTRNPPPAVGLYDSIPFSLYDVSFMTSCGSCAGTLGASYTNAGGGAINLSGSLPSLPGQPVGNCNLSGSLKSDSFAYELWH